MSKLKTMSCRDYVLANKTGAKGCLYNLIAVSAGNLVVLDNMLLDNKTGVGVVITDMENDGVAYG